MATRPNDLGEIDAAFAGFTLVNGHIYTPGGTPYRPGDIEAIMLRRQQLANYELELRTPQQLLL